MINITQAHLEHLKPSIAQELINTSDIDIMWEREGAFAVLKKEHRTSDTTTRILLKGIDTFICIPEDESEISVYGFSFENAENYRRLIRKAIKDFQERPHYKSNERLINPSPTNYTTYTTVSSNKLCEESFFVESLNLMVADYKVEQAAKQAATNTPTAQSFREAMRARAKEAKADKARPVRTALSPKQR